MKVPVENFICMSVMWGNKEYLLKNTISKEFCILVDLDEREEYLVPLSQIRYKDMYFRD